MPYLSFDLDALKMVPDAARSAGIAEAELGYGLVRLWSYCWTAKTDTVKAPHLAGFFGPSEALAPALMAFGFLADDGAGGYRVRGADKYLRITRAQSEAGKNSTSNLRKGAGGGAGEDLRVGPPSQPGTQPGPTSGSAPALTPNTEHRAPSTSPTTSEKAALRLWVVKPPTTPPDEWTGDDFWKWAQSRRQAGGYAPEKMPKAPLGGWWTEVRSHVDAEVMKDAFNAFGNDLHWEKADPPFPWAAFVKQLDKYLPKGAIRAASV